MFQPFLRFYKESVVELNWIALNSWEEVSTLLEILRHYTSSAYTMAAT